jgi:hypothetical protein
LNGTAAVRLASFEIKPPSLDTFINSLENPFSNMAPIMIVTIFYR